MSDLTQVLVPTDFSPASDHAISYAYHLAGRLDAQLHLLHVVPGSVFPVLGLKGGPDRLEAARDALGRLPAEMTPGRVAITRVVREGDPAEEIISYAREHKTSLIAMGTHGRTGLSHALLGSVAEKVIRIAPCPVIVMRPAEDVATTDLPQTPEPSLRQAKESNRVLDLLERALAARATDVHIDPISDQKFKVRFRIDGRLEQFCILDQSVAAPLLLQLKLMSNLDIAQPFEPNEGRLRLPPEMSRIEVRITTVPACGGDAVALRLLEREESPRTLSGLGFSSTAIEAVQDMLHEGEGLLLVTGPTGSGKTTTVHAILQLLDNGQRNIVSIEDPVEYRVPAIRQLSVDLRHGVTMARGLATLLRMDPDVVFIGEIRHAEALEIAMRAASSGRYVLSTLHTRDVASTVTALRDLHADDLSLAGNLKGIVCERLIRRVCPECCDHAPITESERNAFLAEGLEPPPALPRSRGCPRCRKTGFHGRIGVFEVVRTTGAIAELIQRGIPEADLRKAIRATRAPTLMADALAKVRDGLTTLEEAQSIQWA